MKNAVPAIGPIKLPVGSPPARGLSDAVELVLRLILVDQGDRKQEAPEKPGGRLSFQGTTLSNSAY